MNKIFYALLTAVTFVSCAESYSIQGTTSVSALDGSKLYLKTMVNDELKNLDSCDVVHGKFNLQVCLILSRWQVCIWMMNH